MPSTLLVESIRRRQLPPNFHLKMEIITKKLSDFMLPVSDKKQLQELPTNYVKENLNRHNPYAIVYLIYEVANFVMALEQLLFVHLSQ